MYTLFHSSADLTSIERFLYILSKITNSEIILQSDGSLILPKECNAEESDEVEDEDDNENAQPSFPDFNHQIKAALEELGGAVFPKLNWSAPRDASWVGVGHSLKCESLSQIWLLLKSSEFICHDLTQAFKDCVDSEDVNEEITFVLALKKWSNDINPATEFRCYIKQKDLICIGKKLLQSSNSEKY